MNDIGACFELAYKISLEDDGTVVLDASGTRDASGNVTISWDVGGQELVGPFHILSLPPGEVDVVVNAVDGEGNAVSASETLIVPSSREGSSFPIYAPVIAALAALSAWRAVKRINGK